MVECDMWNTQAALRDSKYQLIQSLITSGVLIEECPVSNGVNGTAYWRYTVLQPENLPEELSEEYRTLGEIRW